MVTHYADCSLEMTFNLRSLMATLLMVLLVGACTSVNAYGDGSEYPTGCCCIEGHGQCAGKNGCYSYNGAPAQCQENKGVGRSGQCEDCNGAFP